MNFDTKTICDKLTIGVNWNDIKNTEFLWLAVPDQINAAIVKLEYYNGTLKVMSFRFGPIIKVEQNSLYYNKMDIVEQRHG